MASPPRQLHRVAIASASLAVVAVILSSYGLSSPAQEQGCGAWDVTYAVSGNLELSDTAMGAGDGIYAVGPGEIVLRYGVPAGRVTMLSFDVPQRFGIEVKKLFWAAQVDTDATARAAPAAALRECGHVAEGLMQEGKLAWATSVSGFRTDGVVACTGSLCGRFGAPARGTSGLHIPPADIQLKPFEFAPDGKTFTMASTFVSKTDAPRETAHLALAGREIRRACAPVAACR